jgi:HD-GYP domain-containing protein (c-di-GMP phosphodiesterase class II)
VSEPSPPRILDTNEGRPNLPAALRGSDWLIDTETVAVAADLAELRRGLHRVLVATATAFTRGTVNTHRLSAPYHPQSERIVVIGELPMTAFDLAREVGVSSILREPATETELRVAIESAFELMDAHQRTLRHGERLSRFEYELDELIDIARALTKERDISRLLALILEKSRFVTGADAGSIYVIETTEEAAGESRQVLRFKQAQNDSIALDSSEFSVPVSRASMAGWVVLERQSIRIDDAYQLPENSPFAFDSSFDRKFGYRAKSMLCAPLVSGRGEVIGVLQLINKKRDPRRKLQTADDVERWVQPFDERSEQLVVTLAAQAGIALENALLIEEIQGLFEGFVRASVDAIESRDPTTSGHSRRVAELTLRLAEVADSSNAAPYRAIRFSADELRELKYASLLHDFGKIGVREPVLVKSKKLHPHEIEAIRLRIELGLRDIEARRFARHLEILERGGTPEELGRALAEFDEQREELERAFATVLEAAEPTVLKASDKVLLDRAERLMLRRWDAPSEPLLSASELASLRIERGSLTAPEFEEIRSHVVHTQRFLSRIPWGRALRRVPEIAGAHHERLNGTGYPRGWGAHQIPVQSKMMSIADIYDALTAADRPYKRAVSVERALQILDMEVRDGHLDADLVRLFADAKVWELR